MPKNVIASEIIWCVLVSALLVAAIIAIKYLNKKLGIFPELSRKLLHITMGLAVLYFPFVFQSRITVLVFGGIAFLGMLALRLVSAKKEQAGSFLYAVNRTSSLGELLFPLSVALIFYFSNYNGVLYFVPILILTLADSAAALIGVRYGQKALSDIKEDKKSLEGFVVFFIAAFLCAEIPLMLFTDTKPINIILISIIIAALTAITEASSSHGLDNILIPMLSFAFLKVHLEMDTQRLVLQLVYIAVFIALSFLRSKHANMSKIALMQGLLVAYVIVMLAGLPWLFAAAMLFFGYAVFPSLSEKEKGDVINNHIVETNVAVAVGVLWVASATDTEPFLMYTFFTVFSMRLAINTFIRLRLYYAKPRLNAAVYACVKSYLMINLPAVFMNYAVYGSFPSVIVAAFSLVLPILAIFYVSYSERWTDYGRISARSGWISEAGVGALTIVQMTATFLELTH